MTARERYVHLRLRKPFDPGCCEWSNDALRLQRRWRAREKSCREYGNVLCGQLVRGDERHCDQVQMCVLVKRKLNQNWKGVFAEEIAHPTLRAQVTCCDGGSRMIHCPNLTREVRHNGP